MTLNEDRLGVAFVLGNMWLWDEEVFGPKPDGYDEMTLHEKHIYLSPKLAAVEKIIGTAGTSKAWWRIQLHRPEEEWRKWYFSQKNPHYDLCDYNVQDYIKEAGKNETV